MILLLVALVQDPASAPTVGDTVWAARTIFVPAGAVVRPTPWPDAADAPVQPLGPPVLERHGDSLTIRYPLVIWTPGPHPVEIPGPVLLGPGAAMDSLADESTTLYIESVIPDSVNVDSAAPQPPAATVGGNEHSWTPLLEFALLGIALGLGFLYLGRRRLEGEAVPVASAVTTADPVRWAQAGELRAA
ncbi:MAG TPA: hypothetical protein VFI13_01965, partial [Gemmatimonadales bacterium]|nr:hypothetical protein [Gemmatimonadales bacterium]